MNRYEYLVALLVLFCVVFAIGILVQALGSRNKKTIKLSASAYWLSVGEVTELRGLDGSRDGPYVVTSVTQTSVFVRPFTRLDRAWRWLKRFWRRVRR